MMPKQPAHSSGAMTYRQFESDSDNEEIDQQSRGRVRGRSRSPLRGEPVNADPLSEEHKSHTKYKLRAKEKRKMIEERRIEAERVKSNTSLISGSQSSPGLSNEARLGLGEDFYKACENGNIKVANDVYFKAARGNSLGLISLHINALDMIKKRGFLRLADESEGLKQK